MTFLNPKCRKTTIGIRQQREITLWPLSMADEVQFAERIVGAINEYDSIMRGPSLDEIDPIAAMESISAEPELKEKQVAELIIRSIKENLLELLGYVCDDNVELSELDNEQFVEICDLVYEMNYAGAMGKFKGLLQKTKELLSPPKTQSPNSSSTPATDTNTSTDSATETAE